MNTDKDQLAFELSAFNKLSSTSSIQVITDAYNRILIMVQAVILTRNDPDSTTRAWSLLNDDAYKYLSEIQEGKRDATDELKRTVSQVGQILSIA
ncbi:hypothetical protein [Spirosoma agri]|uniref:Uncharacterized protein n=1 Tax=Spirosoma agri TaxID=1987381 RepID=A0A6M0IR05_9BACT|nr:hypothetical protein [Spirosoma agri]NEU70337.1 hypothetical protein [Spirosoma agri]